MRPRRPGYNAFQERAGEVIHNHLRNDGDAVEVVRTLNYLYQETVKVS
jgi:hypothetical protein